MKSIFYVNSFGFMCQWKGQIMSKDTESISIRFSKKKAFRYKLADTAFCLITDKPIKDIGVCISKITTDAVSFDENLQRKVLDATKGNVDSLLINGKWVV